MLAEDSNVILMLEFAQLGLSGNSTEMGQQLAAYLRSQEPVIRPELSTNPFIAAKEINLLFDPESDWYKTGTTEQIKMINDQNRMKQIVNNSYYGGFVTVEELRWLEQRNHDLYEEKLKGLSSQKSSLTFYSGQVPSTGPLRNVLRLDYSTLPVATKVQLDDHVIATRRTGNVHFYGLRLHGWATKIFDGLTYFISRCRKHPEWIGSCRVEECRNLLLRRHPIPGGHEKAFCSTSCRNKFHQIRKKRNFAGKDQIICQYIKCDQKFIPRTVGGKVKKYCSSKCRIYDYRLRVKES